MNAEYIQPQTAKVNHIVKCPAGGVFADDTPAEPVAEAVEIAFTICTGERPISKTYGVGPDGKPEQVKGAGMANGKATRIALRGTPNDIVQQLAERLTGLTPHEALVLVPPPAAKAQWQVVKK